MKMFVSITQIRWKIPYKYLLGVDRILIEFQIFPGRFHQEQENKCCFKVFVVFATSGNEKGNNFTKWEFSHFNLCLFWTFCSSPMLLKKVYFVSITTSLWALFVVKLTELLKFTYEFISFSFTHFPSCLTHISCSFRVKNNYEFFLHITGSHSWSK